MEEPPGVAETLIARVRSFARSARVAARSGRRCVDGRYPPASGGSGLLARPGGDFGYLLAVLAASRVLRLGWDVETCAARVVQAVIELDGSFSGHTDSLSRGPGAPTGDLAGCGHMSAALQHASAYGLETSEVRAASHHALELARRAGALRITVLDGPHAEQAVLLVRGRAFSLESSLPGHGQYFLYDSDRDREFLGKLAAALDFNAAGTRELERIARQQLDATLTYLAASSPVFTVAVDGEMPAVSPGMEPGETETQ